MTVEKGGKLVIKLDGATKRYRSYPPEELEHLISDYELEQFMSARKDRVDQYFWGCLGVAAGALIPFTQIFERIGSQTSPLTISENLTVIVFFVFAILSAVCFWRAQKKEDHIEKLINEIRTRPRAPTSGPDGPIPEDEPR